MRQWPDRPRHAGVRLGSAGSSEIEAQRPGNGPTVRGASKADAIGGHARLIDFEDAERVERVADVQRQVATPRWIDRCLASRVTVCSVFNTSTHKTTFGMVSDRCRNEFGVSPKLLGTGIVRLLRVALVIVQLRSPALARARGVTP
jgi:hypothetical protein